MNWKLFSNRQCQSKMSLLFAVAWLVLSAGTIGLGQDDRNRDRDSSSRSFNTDGQSGRFLPPGNRPPTSYRLGVTVRNTQTGVLINTVQPASAAQRAGIEAGDTVISVAGYQVGYVDGRLYDLGDEITRRIDRNDRVTLLVQNHRNGRLVNVTVDFSGTGGTGILTVSGVITTRSTVNLNRSATITVRLLDITHNHWQHVPVETINMQVPRTWPMNYELSVAENRISPGHRYAVEAEVTDRGRVVLETAAPVPLAGSRRVDLVLVNASNRPGPGGMSFEEQIKQWYLQYLGRFPTPRETQAWQTDLARGSTMEDIQAGILSSSEYYGRHQNDKDNYVRDVFNQLNGQEPTAQQQQELKQQLEKQNDVRLRFTQELLKQLKNPGSSGR